MEEQNWMKALNQLCCEDNWYQTCLERAMALEPAFEQLRDQLDETHREILEKYIMVCEELDYARQIIAFHLGRNWENRNPM